jgi:capsular exopolysaccharide synthesis family protein
LRHAPELLPHDADHALFHGLDAAVAERLVVSKSAEPMLIEQFRLLAATLHHAQADQRLKTVMVTSAAVGDGKSLIALNLALTLSESYRRKVLLIDADLRRPSLHQVFRVSGSRGLTEWLQATSDEPLPVVQISEMLTLLPAGGRLRDPMGSLSSPRMKRIVEEAATRFDWIILDTPPVGALADAAILSAMVDGAILVVRAGLTPFPEVESAVAALGRDRILGVILNAVDSSEIHGRSYYRHYYGDNGASEPPNR